MKSIRLISLAWLAMLMGWDTVQAQTALPGFTLKELTHGKIQISWINPYQSCIQLAVQRSQDSTKNFRTIFSAQSPELPSNGFVDAQGPAGYYYYYRIFYVLKGGQYFFTSAKRATENVPSDIRVQPLPATKAANVLIRIYKRGRFAFQYEYKDYLKFRDSIIYKTSDSLYTVNADSIDWRPFDSKLLPSWRPSDYVFTNEKGYLSIRLPGFRQHRYRIIFFEENGLELFQIKAVKEAEMSLDKASFIHSGWFQFELYEDEKLKEKNKFFLDRN
jgi:hypothetical protein